MAEPRSTHDLPAIPVLIVVCLLSYPASARYGGGTGEPNDPYLIYTAEHLHAISADPNDWDKHFQLKADIDLDPNLPGRRVYDRAVIAPYDSIRGYNATPFKGAFNGDNHVIRNLTIVSDEHSLGLFGLLDEGAWIRNLTVENASITGAGYQVGSLVGRNQGAVMDCSASGATRGDTSVGGLVGDNDGGMIIRTHSSGVVHGRRVTGGLAGVNGGSVIGSYSTASVAGDGSEIGGLLGMNAGLAICSYSAGTVSGLGIVGGLVGSARFSSTINSYSTSKVSADTYVGGLVGRLDQSILTNTYSTGAVSSNGYAGGLVGFRVMGCFVSRSFWNIETSGMSGSEGGTGLTEAQMQEAQTFIDVGWDLRGETADGLHEAWQMPEGGGYPVLSVFLGFEPPLLAGRGTSQSPYMVSTALELSAIIYHDPRACYRLTGSIDLSGIRWSTPVIPWFEGSFDGAGHVIHGLTISSESAVGLFGVLLKANVYDLGVVDTNIVATGDAVGILAGLNWASAVSRCHTNGAVTGRHRVGGLLGETGLGMAGRITDNHSASTVSGENEVGGLVGRNINPVENSSSAGAVAGKNQVGGLVGSNHGSVQNSCGAGDVMGNEQVGGLIGRNHGDLTNSYSTCMTSGIRTVGGLVGHNDQYGKVLRCYSTGLVRGQSAVGGLVALNHPSAGVVGSFWDREMAGRRLKSQGGQALHTKEMQQIQTYLDAGWDFVGETENGTEDIWWILEGRDYPHLWWEATGH